MKMKIIYNNTNNLDRLLSNGHQFLSHLGHSSTVYTYYRHTYLQCVPTFPGSLKL
jgi:hypothetical protein